MSAPDNVVPFNPVRTGEAGMQREIDRMRTIAADSSAALLTEGPVHADWELLGLCAEVLDLRAQAAAVDREARKMPNAYMANPVFMTQIDERDRLRRRCKQVKSRIHKFPSATAAGVYAKAAVLRGDHGTAPALLKSLMDDLVSCPGLRQSLWPADTAEAQP